MPLITLVSRWKQANWPLLSNAGSMIGTVGINAALGFVFWWFAAQGFSTEQIGVASAAVSAMQLLGTISMLGLGTLLISQLPRCSTSRGSMILTALLLAASVGCLLGVGFALFVRHLSPELITFMARPQEVMLFALGVGLTATTLVLDQALIGMLWGDLQLWRNAGFASSKLLLLILGCSWIGVQTAMAIYTSWILGNILSIIITAVYIICIKRYSIFHRPRLHLLRGLARIALDHHLLNLALQAPGLILPVLVTVLLSAEINAHFYVAWMIAGFVFVAPFALSVALFAVSTGDPSELGPKLRMSVILSIVVGIIANFVLWLGGSMILGVFGKSYVDEAELTLRLLGLGVFGIVIKDHFVAIYRAQGNVVQARGLVVAGMVFEIGLPVLGAVVGGLVGFTVCWLAALYLQALLMAPLVFRVASPQQST